MSFGAVGGAIAGGLASGAASSLLGGGDAESPVKNFNPAGFKGGGFNVKPIRSGSRVIFDITQTDDRGSVVKDLSGRLNRRAERFDDLSTDLNRVEELTNAEDMASARLARIKQARERLKNRQTKVLGDIRENLGRRRVLGSSFAQDAFIRAQNEFAQQDAELALQEQEAIIESRLQEADAIITRIKEEANLIGEASQSRIKAVQTQLDELNTQADIGLQLASGVQATLGANARLQSDLLRDAAASRGQFFAPVVGAVRDTVSSGVSDFVDNNLGFLPFVGGPNQV